MSLVKFVSHSVSNVLIKFIISSISRTFTGFGFKYYLNNLWSLNIFGLFFFDNETIKFVRYKFCLPFKSCSTLLVTSSGAVSVKSSSSILSSPWLWTSLLIFSFFLLRFRFLEFGTISPTVIEALFYFLNFLTFL